ncbi:hypothetical protein GGR57DRAFT_519668 [Xylariaceae sp. FL1272]|nr:hypothetical protein GGR57DRAFT_519668 [Xylariaceae sp. FL1272]
MSALPPPGIDAGIQPDTTHEPDITAEQIQLDPISRGWIIAPEGDMVSGPQFTPFKLLPPELRLEVWEAALDEEAVNRLPVLLDTRIFPVKKLISPLLSVNVESRACALAFYDTKLTVYRLPLPEPDPVFYEEHFVNVDGVDIETEGGWVDQDMFLDTTIDLIDDTENRGTSSGAMYISAKKDRFVLPRWFDLQDVFQFSHIEGPFWTAAAGKLRGEPPRSDSPSLQHVTSQLPISAVQAVETIILAEQSYGDRGLGPFNEIVSFYKYLKDREPYAYPLWRAKLDWKADIFTGLKYWEHLWCFEDPLNKFLQMMFSIEDAGSLDIRQWTEIQREPEDHESWMENRDGEWMQDGEARMKLWEEYQTKLSWSGDARDRGDSECRQQDIFPWATSRAYPTHWLCGWNGYN